VLWECAAVGQAELLYVWEAGSDVGDGLQELWMEAAEGYARDLCVWVRKSNMWKTGFDVIEVRSCGARRVTMCQPILINCAAARYMLLTPVALPHLLKPLPWWHHAALQ
jgi:hypothetical protein